MAMADAGFSHPKVLILRAAAFNGSTLHGLSQLGFPSCSEAVMRERGRGVMHCLRKLTRKQLKAAGIERARG